MPSKWGDTASDSVGEKPKFAALLGRERIVGWLKAFFSENPSPHYSRRWTVVLAVVAAALALGVVLLGFPAARVEVSHGLPVLPVSDRVAFEKLVLGKHDTAARTTNIQIVDFDEDGRNDLLVCDATRNSVLWYRQSPDGGWEERVVHDKLPAPAHATVVDLDQDGDRDLVVSLLGDLFPSDELVGKLIWLENDGGQFRRRLLLDDVRRVADAQPGDFDGDGDLDLAVAVFGYARGQVLWLENRGAGRFRDHQLLSRPGTIHVPVGDLDGDGDLDIAAIVSQDEEELWAFENNGKGEFKPRRLWHTDNYDVGCAGLVLADLDQDDDLDLIVPQGDNLEDRYYWPQPYHGCTWFENRGGWDFRGRKIARVGLAYAAAVGDVDGDGHLDVALAAMTNDFGDPQQASLVWLRNDGLQNFTTWRIDTEPDSLVAIACGDLNGDGKADLAAGSIQLPELRGGRARRIAVWLSRAKTKAKKTSNP